METMYLTVFFKNDLVTKLMRETKIDLDMKKIFGTFTWRKLTTKKDKLRDVVVHLLNSDNNCLYICYGDKYFGFKCSDEITFCNLRHYWYVTSLRRKLLAAGAEEIKRDETGKFV